MPTYAIQVPGYDRNRAQRIKKDIPDSLIPRVKNHPLIPGQFMKHYVMTDQHSGQTIKHIQLIQIKLPRVQKTLFPPRSGFTTEGWWLNRFKHATEDKEADLERLVREKGLMIPEVITKALERLKILKWLPDVTRAYEDDIDRNQYAIMFATERAEEREEGRTESGIEIAKTLLGLRMSVEQISRATRLSVAQIQEISKSMFGV